MRTLLALAAALMVLGALAGCTKAPPAPSAPSTPPTPFAPPVEPPQAEEPVEPIQPVERLPQRGVNLGNALEAPTEGAWGVMIEERFFPTIRDGGFRLVRVPIRWSAHADEAPPYAIAPAFIERIDWIIAQARAHGLTVIINVHHYDELFADPYAQAERFVSLWRQIAVRYQGEDEAVIFELLNEPHGALEGRAWRELMTTTLAAVRETNPHRWVVIGGDGWNSVQGLSRLALPADDRRLIGTFHYYEPFQFTHQGAEWADGSDAWLGTTWTATTAQAAAVRRDLDLAARWATAQDRPVLLGEFGAYGRADAASRAAWTAFVASEAEARGMSWAYWEFCAGFGVYDLEQDAYRESLHRALIPATP
jgi:endoglucanase